MCSRQRTCQKKRSTWQTVWNTNFTWKGSSQFPEIFQLFWHGICSALEYGQEIARIICFFILFLWVWQSGPIHCITWIFLSGCHWDLDLLNCSTCLESPKSRQIELPVTTQEVYEASRPAFGPLAIKIAASKREKSFRGYKDSRVQSIDTYCVAVFCFLLSLVVGIGLLQPELISP